PETSPLASALLYGAAAAMGTPPMKRSHKPRRPEGICIEEYEGGTTEHLIGNPGSSCPWGFVPVPNEKGIGPSENPLRPTGQLDERNPLPQRTYRTDDEPASGDSARPKKSGLRFIGISYRF